MYHEPYFRRFSNTCSISIYPIIFYFLLFAEGEVKVNIDKLSSSSSLSAPLLKDRLLTSTKSSIIQDVVQLGRLKETYASLSVEAKQHAGTCKSDV